MLPEIFIILIIVCTSILINSVVIILLHIKIKWLKRNTVEVVATVLRVDQIGDFIVTRWPVIEYEYNGVIYEADRFYKTGPSKESYRIFKVGRKIKVRCKPVDPVVVIYGNPINMTIALFILLFINALLIYTLARIIYMIW